MATRTSSGLTGAMVLLAALLLVSPVAAQGESPAEVSPTSSESELGVMVGAEVRADAEEEAAASDDEGPAMESQSSPQGDAPEVPVEAGQALPPPPPGDAEWDVPVGYQRQVPPTTRAYLEHPVLRAPEVPEGGATYSYWPGALGMAIGTGVGFGFAFLAVVAAFESESSGLTLAITASMAAPLAVVTGTALGVWLHGRQAGGRGTFWSAFGGAMLGAGITALMGTLLISGIDSDTGASMAGTLTVGLGVTLTPLLASWLYWRKSGRVVREQRARGAVATVVPTFGVTPHGALFGAAGTF